jgi:hypothetical protein
MDLALERYLDIGPHTFTPLSMPAEALTEYTGRYDYDAAAESQFAFVAPSAGTVLVEIGESRDEAAKKAGFPVRFHAPDKLFITSGPFAGYRAEFVRDGHGRVFGLRFGGRILLRAL